MSAPFIIAADWNLSRRKVKKIAKRFCGKVITGHGVDHIVYHRELKVKKVHRRITRHGSDHRPLVVEFERDGQPFTVLWWNVYVGQSPLPVKNHPHVPNVLDNLRDLIEKFNPDVIALGEAYRCHEALSRVRGFELHHQTGSGESADLAILVRNTFEVKRSGRANMHQRWIGPKHNIPKAPREYPRVVFKTGAGRVRFLAAHLPTGGTGGRNGAAVRESIERIVRWAR